ncbi:MAG: PIN domain-containing protein [bacterium]
MNPKKTIYLDTSVPSAYYDEEKPERMRITCGWWKNEMRKFEILISEVTVDELEATSDIDQRKKFAELIEDIEVLKITVESQSLAEKYVKNGVFSVKDFNDALHIAIATVELQWKKISYISSLPAELKPLFFITVKIRVFWVS